MSSRFPQHLAAVALFAGLAGDVFRYSIGWLGWGIVVGVVIILAVVVLVRARMRFASLPPMLALFFIYCALTTIWSDYPAYTAIGTVLSLAAASIGLLLGTQLGARGTLRALSSAARAILALSLAFEFFVAAVIRHRILPIGVDYTTGLKKIPNAYYWSRDLLFSGGRIQGIMGNSNLLAFAALLGLIVFVALMVSGEVGRGVSIIWIAVDLVVLALTRSSTVIIAGFGVVVLVVVVLVARRLAGPARHVFLGLVVLAAVGLAATIIAVPKPFLALFHKSADLTNRAEIWGKVIHLALERPVGGWGWLTYWVPWIEPFKTLAIIKHVRYLQAHETWLDVWFQAGIIGLVLFVLFVLGVIVRSWRAALNAPQGPDAVIALALLALLAALLVQSLAESRLLIEGEFALLVGLAVIARELPVPPPPTNYTSTRVPTSATPA